MTIEDMHYDFKQKLNKIDSNAYRNLLIPEIDWKLNEALNLYVLLVAVPRLRNHLGFETSLRTTDDIRNLVVNDEVLSLASGDGFVIASLNDVTDYSYFLSTAKCIASKGDCTGVRMDVQIIKHGDRSQDVRSTYYKSNFEWRICNIRFYEDGIKIFNEDFTITEFAINYLKKHAYIHNAQGFDASNGYNLPDGTNLTGKQNCELPDITHREIVDLAVLITTGDLVLPLDYQLKQNKLSVEQLN